MSQLMSIRNFGITSDIFPPVTSNPNANGFKEIGIGQPLLIRLHTVHVGDLRNGVRNKKQSVLVTSVIKDDITYGIEPRAVHQIFPSVQDRETLHPRASNEGTELVYYSPAFDGGRLKFDIEVKADRFRQEHIDDIGNGLSTAAGLPVFAPYAPFMLVGSQLLKVAGNVINKAIERVPLLTYSFNISDNIAGISDSEPGFLFGTHTDMLAEFKGYKIEEDPIQKGNVILTRNGQRYNGDVPYIILSVDGTKTLKYENFKATAASATLLKRFYGISQTTTLEDIEDMMKIYNDFVYLEKYKQIEKQINKTEDKALKSELETLKEAYRKNIKNEDLLKTLKL